MALLFIGDPERSWFDQTRIARLYGRSRAESRVAALLASGYRLEQVAEALDIAYETVQAPEADFRQDRHLPAGRVGAHAGHRARRPVDLIASTATDPIRPVSTSSPRVSLDARRRADGLRAPEVIRAASRGEGAEKRGRGRDRAQRRTRAARQRAAEASQNPLP